MAKEKEVKKKLDIEVGDPQELRPVDLPLVVKPGKGQEWENDAQVEFAAIVNAYAYKNPKKWAVKKDVLLKQLEDLGENPEGINSLRGALGGLSFKNRIIEN